MGCSPSADSSPSTVLTSCPSAWTAKSVHDFTGTPSSSTVHAPQLDVSQPMWVPVRPSVPRRKCASSSLVSISAERAVPFTETVTRRVTAPSRGAMTSVTVPPFGRLAQPALGVHPHDVPLVLGGSAQVVDRLGRLGSQPRRLANRVVVQRRSGERGLRGGGLDVRRADAGQADAGAADRPVRERDV